MQAYIQAVVDAQPKAKSVKQGTVTKTKGTSKRFVESVALASTMGKRIKIRRASLNLRKSAAALVE